MMPFERDEIAAFLKYKPISTLWGVGKKTVEVLKPYGILACGDIQSLETTQLAAILGSQRAAEAIKSYSFGISDDTVYWRHESEKSVSNEHTFGEDEKSRNAVRAKLIELVAKVGRRFRLEERWALTAKLKLRNSVFETVSRQTQFDAPVRDDISFREKALALFDAMWPANEPFRSGSSAVRLIGFGVTNIRNSPDSSCQLDFFGAADSEKRKKRERLSETLDRLHGCRIGMAED
jgi:DNA polymerase-4